MKFSKFILTAFYSACLLALPVSASEEKTITTDYLVTDYGRFIRDNTNFNGLFRLAESGDQATAQVIMLIPNSDFMSKAKPTEVVTAELKLQRTNEKEYKITDIVIKNENYTQSFIYKVNGLIRLDVSGDFGSLNMRVKSSVDATGYNEVSYEKVIQDSEVQ